MRNYPATGIRLAWVYLTPSIVYEFLLCIFNITVGEKLFLSKSGEWLTGMTTIKVKPMWWTHWSSGRFVYTRNIVQHLIYMIVIYNI